MPKLVIDLREGFRDDAVTVRVSGRIVAELQGISTDWSIGLARRVEVIAAEDPATVEITLPGRGLAGKAEIPTASDIYVSAALEGGSIRFRIDTRPPEFF